MGPNGVEKSLYDPPNRLTADSANTLTYDHNGNRNNGSYTVGAGNRITNDGTCTYTYNAEGELIKKSKGASAETWNFTYDMNDQMVSAEKHATDGGTLLMKATYVYDVFGRRIEQDVWNGTSTTTTRFSYDHSQIWADLTSANALQTRYMHDDSGGLLARFNNLGVLTGYYQADRLKTTRNLTDSTGAVLDTLTYDAWGTTVSESNSANGDRFKYTGGEFDSETSLYRFGRRYYVTTIGVFTSEDPLSFAAGDTNLSRYVFDAPTLYVDPTGLIAGVGGGGSGGANASQGDQGLRDAQGGHYDQQSPYSPGGSTPDDYINGTRKGGSSSGSDGGGSSQPPKKKKWEPVIHKPYDGPPLPEPDPEGGPWWWWWPPIPSILEPPISGGGGGSSGGGGGSGGHGGGGQGGGGQGGGGSGYVPPQPPQPPTPEPPVYPPVPQPPNPQPPTPGGGGDDTTGGGGGKRGGKGGEGQDGYGGQKWQVDEQGKNDQGESQPQNEEAKNEQGGSQSQSALKYSVFDPGEPEKPGEPKQEMLVGPPEPVPIPPEYDLDPVSKQQKRYMEKYKPGGYKPEEQKQKQQQPKVNFKPPPPPFVDVTLPIFQLPRRAVRKRPPQGMEREDREHRTGTWRPNDFWIKFIRGSWDIFRKGCVGLASIRLGTATPTKVNDSSGKEYTVFSNYPHATPGRDVHLFREGWLTDGNARDREKLWDKNPPGLRAAKDFVKRMMETTGKRYSIFAIQSTSPLRERQQVFEEWKVSEAQHRANGDRAEPFESWKEGWTDPLEIDHRQLPVQEAGFNYATLWEVGRLGNPFDPQVTYWEDATGPMDKDGVQVRHVAELDTYPTTVYAVIDVSNVPDAPPLRLWGIK